MSEEKVPLRPQIRELELGKSISFPIQRMRTIKTTCSELGVIYCRKFRTKIHNDAYLFSFSHSARFHHNSPPFSFS